METQQIQVGPVYRDPKGKVSRGGEQEHCFIVRRVGGFVDVMRYGSREAAEGAREAVVA